MQVIAISKNKGNILEDEVVATEGSSLVVNTITGNIVVKHPNGSEVETKIPIKDVVVTRPMLNVGLNASHTKNLGDYNSARISVSLNMPCELHELENTYAFVKDWVNGKMIEINDELK